MPPASLLGRKRTRCCQTEIFRKYRRGAARRSTGFLRAVQPATAARFDRLDGIKLLGKLLGKRLKGETVVI